MCCALTQPKKGQQKDLQKTQFAFREGSNEERKYVSGVSAWAAPAMKREYR
jgi:hypothetical protein